MNQTNQTVGNQIGDMLGSPSKQVDQVDTDDASLEGGEEELSDEKAEDQEDKEEKPGEEEKVSEEAEGDRAGDEGEEGQEEEVDEGEKGEAGGEDAKTPVELEMEALRKQNELLQAQLNEVSEKRSAPEEEDEEAPKLEVGDDFVGPDDDLDALFADSKKINATLGKTASKAANVAIEHVYKKLPAIITKIVQDEVSNYRQADQFFVDNKDLVPHRQFVSYVYQEMVAKDPETTPLDHFKSLAKEVRKRIGMGDQLPPGQKGEKKKGKRRSTFNPPGGRPVSPPSTPKGIGAEINKLMNV